MPDPEAETHDSDELTDQFREAVEEALEESDLVTADEAEEIIESELSKSDFDDEESSGDELPPELEEELEDEERENGSVSPERAGEILDRITDDPEGAEDTEKAIPLGTLGAVAAGGLLGSVTSGKADGEEDASHYDDSDVVPEGPSIGDRLEEEGVPDDIIQAVEEYLKENGVEKALDVRDTDSYLAQQLDTNMGQLDEKRERLKRAQEARAAEVASGDAEAPVLDAVVYDEEGN